MPRVPPFDRPATYEDLVALPEHLVAEIVDGELHASPRPGPRHTLSGSGLGVLIGGPYQFGINGPGGWWILDEPELHLGRDVLVPDLAGWHCSRMPALPETAHFPLAPDWICEVLSPSTAMLDRAGKLGIYAREGVANAWLIDPLARTLEMLRSEGGQWLVLATHGGDEVVRCEPFGQVDLDLRALWSAPMESRKVTTGSQAMTDS